MRDTSLKVLSHLPVGHTNILVIAYFLSKIRTNFEIIRTEPNLIVEVSTEITPLLKD